ncbi:hypothetical protein C0995_005904, partial [Termitomyces sp. Mi166
HPGISHSASQSAKSYRPGTRYSEWEYLHQQSMFVRLHRCIRLTYVFRGSGGLWPHPFRFPGLHWRHHGWNREWNRHQAWNVGSDCFWKLYRRVRRDPRPWLQRL